MAARLITLLSLTASTAEAGGTLSLSWSDCGDGSTHGKVTGLTPTSLTLGQTTPAVGTGSLDEAVTGGTFAINLEAGIIKKAWSGDLCSEKKLALPLNTGSITWKGLGCPLAAGAAKVPLDILLSSSIPSALLKTTITVQATSAKGDKLLCMKINTAPAELLETNASQPIEAMPAVNAGTLALAWKDCGDSSTHGKISGLTPSTITLGTKTAATGTGTLDEGVQGGNFAIDMKAGIISKHWTGDMCAAKEFKLPLGAGTIDWKGLKCPLAAGSTSVSLDILLSSAIPAMLMKSTISVTATATSGDKLLCMEIDTKPMAATSSEMVV